MKISLLTDGIFPYVIGGMQKHSYYMAKYLARNQVSVDLYHMLSDSAEPIQELDGFSAEESEYIRLIEVAFPKLRYFPGHYLKASHIYSERILECLVQNLEGVDLVYAQGFTGWAALEAKQRGKKMPPILVNPHGLEMFQRPPGFKNRLEHILYRPPTIKNLRMADVAVSLGGKLTDIIHSVGVPRERICEIPIGIGEDWLVEHQPEASAVRKFIFVGRYQRLKGIEELYATLKELLPAHKFEFHFVGPIPDNLKLTHPQVHYWGLIKESEKLREIMATCDILVCPSYSEGMPTVIMEAMASRLAVIATDVGAVREQVSAINGWLIEAGDTRQLREAMVDALKISDTAMMEKKRQSHSLIKRSFTWGVIAQRTLDSLERIAASATKTA